LGEWGKDAAEAPETNAAQRVRALPRMTVRPSRKLPASWKVRYPHG
jgi:hypothetical protein